MANSIPHYRAYLEAHATAEALLMAHASSDQGSVAFHDKSAERHFRQLAAELGFRVEKLPAVTGETATREAA
ncbi:hypothetical protein SAMN02745157_4830 [Kaistia soli DSM 19436]|uniref:Uncharacterized protein n=1 Tax=Kaistia soli DSM 19436 TaxID=1122133 RepID=A0A1M5MND8_9HYPH|nr:hypothetical protein [Kaistia soli]SHG78697.1 hypothetical protein SAMN02745157_4830 [Kaistia soli DSM 19436]